jgi:hypothetical protein
MATATLNIAALRASLKTRLHASQSKMQRIGNAAHEQIQDRFRTSGASGGSTWPPTVTELGKVPPLGSIADSFVVEAQDGSASVGSEGHWAARMHLGTIGKGGILPDVVPVNAKALFIPLTLAGVLHYEAYKARGPVVTSIYGGINTIYVPKFQKHSFVGIPQAVYGTDYVFAQKSSLPPRPQLPVSDHERADLAAKATKILAAP